MQHPRWLAKEHTTAALCHLLQAHWHFGCAALHIVIVIDKNLWASLPLDSCSYERVGDHFGVVCVTRLQVPKHTLFDESSRKTVELACTQQSQDFAIILSYWQAQVCGNAGDELT